MQKIQGIHRYPLEKASMQYSFSNFYHCTPFIMQSTGLNPVQCFVELYVREENSKLVYVLD